DCLVCHVISKILEPWGNLQSCGRLRENDQNQRHRFANALATASRTVFSGTTRSGCVSSEISCNFEPLPAISAKGGEIGTRRRSLGVGCGFIPFKSVTTSALPARIATSSAVFWSPSLAATSDRNRLSPPGGEFIASRRSVIRSGEPHGAATWR